MAPITSSSFLKIKGLFILLILTCLGTTRAQDKRYEVSPTLGWVVHHQDLGNSFQNFNHGVHMGVNLYNAREKRFKSDLQLSLNTSGVGNFGGNVMSINALYGGRYYISDPGKRSKVFANALVGGTFVVENGDDYIENFLDLGYSLGIFFRADRWILGTSAESYNNFILKVGYAF